MASEEDFKSFIRESGLAMPVFSHEGLDAGPNALTNENAQPTGQPRSLMDVVNNPSLLNQGRGAQTPVGNFSSDGFYSKLKERREGGGTPSPGSKSPGRGSDTMKFFEKLKASGRNSEEINEGGEPDPAHHSPAHYSPAHHTADQYTRRPPAPIGLKVRRPDNIDPSTHTQCPNCSVSLKIPKPGWFASCGSCGKTFSREELVSE
jgi:hypothetical protein